MVRWGRRDQTRQVARANCVEARSAGWAELAAGFRNELYLKNLEVIKCLSVEESQHGWSNTVTAQILYNMHVLLGTSPNRVDFRDELY